MGGDGGELSISNSFLVAPYLRWRTEQNRSKHLLYLDYLHQTRRPMLLLPSLKRITYKYTLPKSFQTLYWFMLWPAMCSWAGSRESSPDLVFFPITETLEFTIFLKTITVVLIYISSNMCWSWPFALCPSSVVYTFVFHPRLTLITKKAPRAGSGSHRRCLSLHPRAPSVLGTVRQGDPSWQITSSLCHESMAVWSASVPQQ